MNEKYKKVYGLTGGIASGKSSVARVLKEFGFVVLDADQISRSLSTEGGLAAPAIQKEFGTLDRKLLREKIFGDAAARKKLEAILHPLIRSETERLLAEVRKNEPEIPVFYEAALLVEGNRVHDFEGLIVVTAPLEDRIKRLMKRNQTTREMAEKMIRSQISDEERNRHATYRVENNGSYDDLKKSVKTLAEQIVAR